MKHRRLSLIAPAIVALLAIVNQFPALAEAVSKMDPNRHVLQGKDALPSATRELTEGRRPKSAISSHPDNQDHKQ